MAFVDGIAFDESVVGKGGAGFLWEVDLDEERISASSLAQPPPWTVDDGGSSDEAASVVTAEDIASETMEPTEGAADVSDIFAYLMRRTLTACHTFGDMPASTEFSCL